MPPDTLTFEALEGQIKAAQERYAKRINPAEQHVVDAGTWQTSVAEETLSIACPGFTYYRNEDETYQPTLTTGYRNETFYFDHWVIHLMGVIQSKGTLQATYALLIDNDSEVPIDLHFRVPGETDQARLDYAEAALTKLMALTHQTQENPLLLFRKQASRR